MKPPRNCPPPSTAHAWIAALCFLLSLHALDFITTYIGGMQGLCEGNVLFRDTTTCGLMSMEAVKGKSLGLLLYSVGPSLFLEAGFRNRYLTSAPLWYAAWLLLPTIANNLILIIF